MSKGARTYTHMHTHRCRRHQQYYARTCTHTRVAALTQIHLQLHIVAGRTSLTSTTGHPHTLYPSVSLASTFAVSWCITPVRTPVGTERHSPSLQSPFPSYAYSYPLYPLIVRDHLGFSFDGLASLSHSFPRLVSQAN